MPQGGASQIDDSNDSSSGTIDSDSERAVPPDIIDVLDVSSIDDIPEGSTFEEILQEVSGSYMTTYPLEFFRDVWYDGLMAVPYEHWTIPDSDTLLPNSALISGTQVEVKYVVTT